MKKYKVNVNGTEYEIALEVIDSADVSVPAAAPIARKWYIPMPLNASVW